MTAGGTSAALAAKPATTTLPIVFAAVGDPVAEGLVTSLGRPGGNVSGLSVGSPELIVKSLELLKEVVPGVSRVALLLKPDSIPDRARKDRLEAAAIGARTLGVQLHPVEARGPEDFDRALSDMTRARAGALQVATTPVFESHRRRLVDLAAKNQCRRCTPSRVGLKRGPDVCARVDSDAGMGHERSMMRAMARSTVAVALLLLLAAWFSAEAQRPHVARIGIIQSGSPATSAGLVDAFSQRLRELGYVKGRNITIEVRYADDIRYALTQPQRYRDLAVELVGLQADVIVTSGTLATRAAKEVTSTIPIVMVSAGDAVAAGLVRSLAQPGGNVTGQSFMGPELAVKGFDLLTEAFPRSKRIAALFNPGIARGGDPAGIRAVGAAAQARGVVLQPVEFRHPDDLDRALAPVGKARPDALLVFAVNAVQLRQLVEFAAKHRLPAIYGFREAVDGGGLMSFGPKLPELWRGAANYVDRILKGAQPSSLPVEQPTTFELVVNLKTAKTLGVIIPPALLARADQVIQ